MSEGDGKYTIGSTYRVLAAAATHLAVDEILGTGTFLFQSESQQVAFIEEQKMRSWLILYLVRCDEDRWQSLGASPMPLQKVKLGAYKMVGRSVAVYECRMNVFILLDALRYQVGIKVFNHWNV